MKLEAGLWRAARADPAAASTDGLSAPQRGEDLAALVGRRRPVEERVEQPALAAAVAAQDESQLGGTREQQLAQDRARRAAARLRVVEQVAQVAEQRADLAALAEERLEVRPTPVAPRDALRVQGQQHVLVARRLGADRE